MIPQIYVSADEQNTTILAFSDEDFAQYNDHNNLKSSSCSCRDEFDLYQHKAENPEHNSFAALTGEDHRQYLEAMCDHAHRLATVYKDFDCAILTYIDVIREDTAHVRALANLGALYHKKGELDNARVIYLRALQEEPFRSKTTYNLGRLEHETGNHEEARDMYERALLLDCDAVTRSNSLAYLGQLQHQVYGDFEKAMHCYDHCLARSPAHARAMDFKCALLVALGRLPEAKALHMRVCVLESDHM
jgi:tetratricopeptide (TPR) repeat protein